MLQFVDLKLRIQNTFYQHSKALDYDIYQSVATLPLSHEHEHLRRGFTFSCFISRKHYFGLFAFEKLKNMHYCGSIILVNYLCKNIHFRLILYYHYYGHNIT